MTPDQHRERRLKALEPWMGKIASLMGLSHWSIFRSPERPDGENTIASVQPVYGRYYAVLRLSDGFLDRESPSDQRNTIVHECLHIHLAQLQRIAEENIPESVFPQFRLALEYAVDGMAKAWSEHMPLPPQSKTKGK